MRAHLAENWQMAAKTWMIWLGETFQRRQVEFRIEKSMTWMVLIVDSMDAVGKEYTAL
jgi:hypothetical protein